MIAMGAEVQNIKWSSADQILISDHILHPPTACATEWHHTKSLSSIPAHRNRHMRSSSEIRSTTASMKAKYSQAPPSSVCKNPICGLKSTASRVMLDMKMFGDSKDWIAPLIAIRGSMVVMVRRKEDGMVTGPGMRDRLWHIAMVDVAAWVCDMKG